MTLPNIVYGKLLISARAGDLVPVILQTKRLSKKDRIILLKKIQEYLEC